MSPRICSLEGCRNDTSKGARGLCGLHASRVKRLGHPGPVGYLRRPGRTLEERILERVRTGPTCWTWDGAIGKRGYAIVGDGQRLIYVHRWMFEREKGPIAEGLVIDHLCCNRACINPAHLEAVTRAENNRRGGFTTQGARARGAA